jgi:hypothetical protein
MKERPILFSAPMVNAILEGRKTQTRRIIKPQPEFIGESTAWRWDGKKGSFRGAMGTHIEEMNIAPYCPYGRAGDQLWVRETFGWGKFINGHQFIEYRASPETQDTDAMGEGAPWKPSIHMPRSASRIDLLIKNVRVERLQDISEEDSLAEGVVDDLKGTEFEAPDGAQYVAGPVTWFAQLWSRINGIQSWRDNPWVWVVEFERAKP